MVTKKKSTYQLLRDQVTKFSDSIIALVNNDDLEKAVELTQKFVKQFSIKLTNERITLSAELTRVSSQYDQGMIEFSEYNRVRNRISGAILSKLELIPKELDRLIEEEEQTRTIEFLTPSTNENDNEVDESDLEKIIGETSQLMQIAFLQKALKASASICRVVRPDGGKGTGFLVEGGYLFTNNHVLKTANMANGSKIEFNYELDEMGNAKEVKTYELDGRDFLTDETLDFARVKVLDPDGDLKSWGALKINTDYTPQIDEPVNIIQHPKGGFKQIALTANEVINNNWKYYLFYSADTEPGSSGSPVFNQNWEVIAIHHAGRLMEEGGGLQINEEGERRSANRGIYLRNILKKLEELIEKRGPLPEVVQEEGTNSSPTVVSSGPKNFFLMYDNADRDQVAILKKHLSVMSQNGQISLSDMHDLPAGVLSEQIEAALKKADYVLAMITYNFMFSSRNLVQKARDEEKIIIPVLLNEAFMEGTYINELKKLPSTGLPVEKWSNRDSAYVDIVQQIHRLIISSN